MEKIGFRLDNYKDKKAQSILEYAMIIAVVVAALMAMSVYVQRSLQANLKMVEEQINADAIHH